MSLWRHHDFRRLWAAETISQLGTQVTLLALPLAAIVVLKASPFQVGLLGVFEFVPFLLVGLPAGVWVDRLRRRPILVAADVGRALLLGSIPLAHAFGALHLSQLYAVSLLAGVLTVFFDVAYQSVLPSLVGREHLVEGNAKLEGSRSAAQLAGPGLAGLLVGAITAPPAIAVDALSFFASAAFILRLRVDESGIAGAAPARRMRTEIAEGVRYVVGHPLLRAIASYTSLSNLFSTMAFAVLLLYEVRELGLSPGVVGLVLTLGNVGVLVGAFAAGRAARRLGVGRAIVGSAVLCGPAQLMIPLAPKAFPIPVLVAGQFLLGLGGVVYNVNQVSLRQTITPDHLLGRMNATMRFLVWGTMPLGALLGGALGGAIGLRPTLWVAGAGAMVAFVPLLLSTVRGLETFPDPALAPDAAPAFMS